MAALIGMAAAGFVLKGAAETAVHLIPVQWYSRAHALVRVAGLDRITCLLGCLGLCLALLCVSCATAIPTLARKKKTIPFLDTASVGLTIFLGCGISGSLLGSTCGTLTASGLRGFCVFGFIFSFILLFTNKRQIAETPSRMLVLHAVTLLTMYLGVWSGRDIDATKPRLCLVNILLALATCVMGLLVTLMLKRRRECITFIFVLLVPFSGLVFGIGTERHRGEEPRLHHTYYSVQFLVYTLEILTGILGTLGGICVSLWDPGRAGRLAFWTSVPAAVTLYALDEDSPHTYVLSVAQECVGAAELLGLISGLAAASGVALGLAITSAGEVLWLLAVPVLGAAGVDVMSFSLRPAAVSRTNPRALVDAAVNFAVLSVVMMGSAVLGVAGFLTASLGSAGLNGTVLAAMITGLTALKLLSK